MIKTKLELIAFLIAREQARIAAGPVVPVEDSKTNEGKKPE